MSNVYIVHKSWPYEGIVEIVGAYTSKELAENAIKNYEEIFGEKELSNFEIEEFELDKYGSRATWAFNKKGEMFLFSEESND